MAQNLNVREGKCFNFRNCPKADAKEIQKINLGDEFICTNSECGSDLVEIPPPKKYLKLILLIAGTILVLGVSSYFVFFAGNGNTSEEAKQIEQVVEYPIPSTDISLDQPTLSLDKAGATAQLTATVLPDNATDKSVIWSSSDDAVATVSETGVVTAKANGSAVIKASTGNNISASCEVTVDETPPPPHPCGNSGTVSVSGGKYTGQLQNCKPHGMGTIRYNARTLIDNRDLKKRYAEAGQSIKGQFKNGRLEQGRLYDGSGNHIETVIIGGGAH